MTLKWKYKVKYRILLILFLIAIILYSLWSLLASNFLPKQISYLGLGSQKTVSGSLHIIRVGDYKYIIDIGSFYGDEGENYPLPEQIEIDNIRAVFITHAHADHIGRLPLLLHNGYEGPIYMTEPTYELGKTMLFSAIRFQDFGKEEFYYSRNNRSKIKPVYLQGFDYGRYEVKESNRIFIMAKRSDLNRLGFYMAGDLVKQLEAQLLDRLLRQVELVNYNEPFNVNGVKVEFLNTSHIPGSTIIILTVDDKKILFSGDVGNDHHPFLKKNPIIEENIDFMFLEGTYGVNPLPHDISLERIKFRQHIGTRIKEGYRIIIPAFVLDRTQQVLYEISKGIFDGLIPPETPVKVYSPTSEKITRAYVYYASNREYYESYFNEDFSKRFFYIPTLIYNPRNKDGYYLTTVEHGEVAIMSSGMASEVFSKDAVKTYIQDPNTLFMLVGYQAEDTIGRALFEDQKTISLDGTEKPVIAEVFKTRAFSGHGDFEVISRIIENTNPKKIFITHLNADDESSLINAYQELHPEANVIVPSLGIPYILH